MIRLGGLLADSPIAAATVAAESTRALSTRRRSGGGTRGSRNTSRTTGKSSNDSGERVIHYKANSMYTKCGRKLKDVKYTTDRKKVTCKKCKKLMR